MPNIWETLQSLKDTEYKPSKFNPLDTESFELLISAEALDALESSPYESKHLSRFAYVTFLLGQAFNLPNISVKVDGMSSMDQYMPIAKKLGYCSQSGFYLTAKISPDDLMLRSMTHVKVKGIPNFLRAWFLIVLANTKVLPKLLNSMQDHCSFKEFHNNLIEYYTHISEVFIPNLFQILSSSSVTKGMKVLLHLSKLLLDFPAQILTSTIEYSRRMNDYALNNIDTLTISELLAVIQLNEYLEICHGQQLLIDVDKLILINRIISQTISLRHDDVLMLMRLRYTIFFTHQKHMGTLRDLFYNCVTNEQNKFQGQHPIQHELDIYNIIKNKVIKSDRKFLHHSCVCPQTGKEVDIAFIKESYKVAIHIDGNGSHYYHDRKVLNRKTKTSRKALENAGWINIDQPLPRITLIGETLRAHVHLKNETAELLGKLQKVLPMVVDPVAISTNKLRAG